MRRTLPLLLLLTGCMAHSRGVPAGPGALSCAGQLLTGAGYAVEQSESSLLAQKQLAQTGFYPVFAEIAVHVWRGGDGERMRVEGRRFEQLTGSTPPAAPPVLRPLSGPQQERDPGTRVRRAGRRDLPPGPVTEEVERVRTSCGEAAHT